jgi:hypothetical protein
LKRIFALIGVVAVVSVALPTATSLAAGEPSCSPDTDPVATFAGLPHQVVTGRIYRFNLTNEGLGVGSVHSDQIEVEMSEAGAPFFKTLVNAWSLPAELGVRADAGDGPLTITARYIEYQILPDGEVCGRTISRVIQPIRGRKMPKPSVSVRGDRVVFALKRPSRCSLTYAPTPVSLRVKAPRAKRWVSVDASDQCYGWDRKSARGPGLRIHEDRGRLIADLLTPRRNGVSKFRYEIRSQKGALKRGVIRVTTKHKPAERIYSMTPDGRINDRYWNYCVNSGRTAWMDNGNAYCLTRSSTRRRVTIGR